MTDGYPTLVATVLDATDARELAEFYRQLLGFTYAPGDEQPAAGEPDPRGAEWLVLRDRAGQPRLAVQQVPQLREASWPSGEVPQQLHLDLSVPGVDELRAQHERAVALGARLLEDRSADQDEALVVLADPAGHPFCIIALPHLS